METYIPVHVPEKYLPEILTRLVSLMTHAQSVPQPEAGVDVTTERAEITEVKWSDKLMRDVYCDVTEDMRTVLVSLAQHPGERLSVSDLAAFLNGQEGPARQEGAVRAALSSLTKRVKSYGEASWPFTLHEDGRTGRYSYEMDEGTAAQVLKVRDWFDGIVGDA